MVEPKAGHALCPESPSSSFPPQTAYPSLGSSMQAQVSFKWGLSQPSERTDGPAHWSIGQNPPPPKSRPVGLGCSPEEWRVSYPGALCYPRRKRPPGASQGEPTQSALTQFSMFFLVEAKSKRNICFPEATSLDDKSKTQAESWLCDLPALDKSPPFKSCILAQSL